MRSSAPRRLFLAIAAVLTAPSAAPAETYTLTEPAHDTRPFRVSTRLTVAGEVHTPTLGGKPAVHKLDVVANHEFRERRLTGAGRDAAALRSLRAYEQANLKTSVGDHTTYGRLPRDRSLVVAQGRREGILAWSPAGTMTRGEIDLLQTPADSLAVLGLLPSKGVEVGDTWTPESWVPQMLTNTEAVGKNSLKCKLESTDAGAARITFEGQLEGATHGAAADLTLRGELSYDLKAKHVTRWTLTQTEKRAIGAIDPGLAVEATATGQRTVADRGPLTDAALAEIPLEPAPGQLELSLDLPWGLRIAHGRDWHVYQMNEKAVVLRLMEAGNLLGQCNINRLPAAAPGQHLTEEQFRDEIRSTLGDRLAELREAETLPAAGGRYVCRIRATGAVKEQPYLWTYYLCADPSGRQLAFVFTSEPEVADCLADREVRIVNSLRETSASLTPARTDADTRSR